MIETEYKQHFDIIRNEITAATNAFYTYIEINKFASESPEKYDRINRDANFWNIHLYGLQTTWFIVLGRIFDRSSGAYSIHDFLAATVAYRGFFSKRALADRKRDAAREDQPSWLNEYLKSAWEPTTAELENIAAAIKPSEAKYKESYKAIRDQVFAHREPTEVASKLFENTLISEIEDILFDLHEIVEAIFQLLENGRQHRIGDGRRSYIDRIVADARNVLDRL